MASGKPRFLAENIFDNWRNPTHVVATDSLLAGFEPWRVGAARRETRQGWKPAVDNTEAEVSVDCQTSKMCDMFALTAGHNLAGFQAILEGSQVAAFTTVSTAFDIVVPSLTTAGSRLDAEPYARTWDGDLVGYFPPVGGRYWRLRVPQMGANLRPQVVGLQVGKSVQFANGPVFPYSDARVQLAYDEILSPSLWAASTRKARRRSAGGVPIAIPLEPGELDLVERHLTHIYWAGSAMWIVTNDERAERSVQVYAPPGHHGPVQSLEDPDGLLLVDWNEHQPQQL